MTINDINIAISNLVVVSSNGLNQWEIKTNAKFENGEDIKIYLVNEHNHWYLTDKKNTLKYMNDLYDLKAPDVKSCISAVIKIYGFSISAGALKADIIDEVEFQSKLFDFVMCIGQLANMYAFFDKP